MTERLKLQNDVKSYEAVTYLITCQNVCGDQNSTSVSRNIQLRNLQTTKLMRFFSESELWLMMLWHTERHCWNIHVKPRFHLCRASRPRCGMLISVIISFQGWISDVTYLVLAFGLIISGNICVESDVIHTSGPLINGNSKNVSPKESKRQASQSPSISVNVISWLLRDCAY